MTSEIKKLAIITTHPIQYYAPLFKMLAQRCDVKVFYTWGEKSISKYDPGFQREIYWDIPLLEGYAYEMLQNVSNDPGTHHFFGINNPSIIEKIDAFEPQAILVIGWSFKSHLQVLRHFKGKLPVWFRGDSTLLDHTPLAKRWLRSFLLRWVYSHVDKALYVGTNNKDYFLKHGIHEGNLIFCPHAVDNLRFSTEYSQEAKNMRANLDIHDDDILILFAGKLESKKDPHLLLEAFRTMNAPKVKLLFVGNGELELQLKNLPEGSGRNVYFVDFQNQAQMPQVYQACDLFCLPSRGPGETWGLAVNEAMASGKAVLVSDKVGCAIDLVKPGYNGEIFKAGDVMDLAKKLEKLASRELLRSYGSTSRKLISAWSHLVTVENIVAELQN